jgi:triosephosphate isomerase
MAARFISNGAAQTGLGFPARLADHGMPLVLIGHNEARLD